MNESYAEAGCKRKDTPLTYLMRAGLILLAAVVFIVTLGNQILLVIGAAAVVGVIYILPRLNIEYEYIFCDGQIDFDRISGGAKRKTLKKIDFEQVEICAPSTSHALDGYTYQNVKAFDFSSGDKNAKTYTIIVRDQGVVNKIIFEPTDKMLQCIRSKAPRKIVFE